MMAQPRLRQSEIGLDPRNRALFKTPLWGVLLNRNQWNLGRCIVYLRTRPVHDPLDLSDEERDALWVEVLPRLAGGLDRAFAPDRINYAHLANRLHHVHWHVVPRYEDPAERTFAGWTFVDHRIGQNFRSRKSGKVPGEVYREIRRHLRAQLEDTGAPEAGGPRPEA